MTKVQVTIVTLIIIVFGVGIFFAFQRTKGNLENANSVQSNEQVLGANGVTFSSPSGINWVDSGSTAGNYKNYYVGAPFPEYASSIEISIPLKETGTMYSLADSVKTFTDVSGIHASVLNGHTGEAITYRRDTRQNMNDIPWVGTVTKEQYPSQYSSSPVGLTYAHGDGNDTLDAAWEQVRASIRWLVSTKTATVSSSILKDIGASELSAADKEILDSRIEQWQLYNPDASVSLGGLDCGYSENHNRLVALNQSSKSSLFLNDGLLITSTPNLYGWDNAALHAFVSDPTVVCGVATTVPRAVVGDRILWWNTCIGGAGPPDSHSADYQRTVRCVQVEDVVMRHFGLSE